MSERSSRSGSTRRNRLPEREEAIRRYLREHHARVEPDAGFADRVVSRLVRPREELLGWAALRLLPAAIALALALFWWTADLGSSPASTQVAESDVAQTTATDDPLVWLLQTEEARR